MAADEEECDDHHQRQSQEDAKADGVVDALLVFG